MKLSSKSPDLLPFIIAEYFIIFTLFILPAYDSFNGFYNLMLSSYEPFWMEGKSANNFFIVKKMVLNNSVSFNSDEKIPCFEFGTGKNTSVGFEGNYDFEEKEGMYVPRYNIHFLYPVVLFLKTLQVRSDLLIFKYGLLFNTIMASATLVVFYFIQRKLGLKRLYSSLSMIMLAIATSFLIYSRSFMFQETIYTFFFTLSIYFFLNKETPKRRILLPLTLSLFLFFFYIPLVFILLPFLCYFLKENRRTFIILGILAILLNFMFIYSVRGHWGIPSSLTSGSVVSYPQFVRPTDFEVHYSITKEYPYIYAFGEEPGNAIFLHTRSSFASLFSERGFIYNSPFLVFSIMGILTYIGKEKKFLIWTILLFIILFGVLNPYWIGWIRYVRRFNIPIMFLSFFSFYWLQASNSKFWKGVFLIFIVLSVLNVCSLSVRRDWTYEHIRDLVSYDLVLFPFTRW